VEFDWDESKAVSNFNKHGIDFDDALEVFSDPLARTTEATGPEFGEIRYKVVGTAGERVIAVIYTDRGTVRRIISARRSRRNERRDYHSQGQASR
jgi:uncharacterized DUF497 family protein